MALRSSIDLGTNTCLLLIAETDARGQVTRVAEDRMRVVRLGQGVDASRELHPDAVARTLACLSDYARAVRAQGLDPAQTVCVATATARDARNGVEFFERVSRETGFKFQVIAGEQEARWSFMGGLLPGMDPDRTVVIDIGGGSTEFVRQVADAVLGVSLQMGSVRMTERFFETDPVTDSEFWACQEWIDGEIARAVPAEVCGAKGLGLVGVAGTVTTLAQWQAGIESFDARALDSMVLTRGDVHRAVEEIKWRNAHERRQMTGIEEGRADVILAGALILWRAMELRDFPRLTVSTRGLRFGALSHSR